jgi:hypothetical protein
MTSHTLVRQGRGWVAAPTPPDAGEIAARLDVVESALVHALARLDALPDPARPQAGGQP